MQHGLKRSAYRVCAIVALCLHSVQSFSAHIYDREQQKNISQVELVAALSQADIVLIGEKHDDSAHHQAEYRLLADSATARQHGSVLLEMLTPSQQKQVDTVQRWLAKGGKSGQRNLAQKLGWNEAWPWARYQQVMNLIMYQKPAVLAANPNREDVQAAGAFMPSAALAQSIEVRQALGQIMGVGPQHALVGKQQFKDDFMAKTLLAAPKPAWLIAGSIHTSKLLGVPLYLADQPQAGQVKVVVLTEEGTEIDAAHADYIWFLDALTPAE
ncbi:ChaN family lipoprotein [Acinetobacter larvae]|uniref:Haem-binding uptake Tiki superfamily ChaN domain-containing protein n=1 Tax=Acinetobacter larvae TaxID=1789224 RepID=A0A1B2LVT1_9GAMM|nr:ChaN family lipoprotein [Acinetobacter larvae]AOA57035.1 hypothetical protein BFG52_00795 [Acinetobacter larvae]